MLAGGHVAGWSRSIASDSVDEGTIGGPTGFHRSVESFVVFTQVGESVIGFGSFGIRPL